MSAKKNTFVLRSDPDEVAHAAPTSALLRAVRSAASERERSICAIQQHGEALIQELDELRLALDDEREALALLAESLSVSENDTK